MCDIHNNCCSILDKLDLLVNNIWFEHKLCMNDQVGDIGLGWNILWIGVFSSLVKSRFKIL